MGPYVCAFIEEYLVYGPGDLFGQPVDLNPEQQAWIYRMYEIEPRLIGSRRGGRTVKTKNPRAGKRRFERGVLSLRKGSSKTELAAWIAICELHRDGPVRCAGFGTVGGVPNQPLPRSVTDPYIPMISNTEEQVSELAYGALRRILEESTLASDFDIGLERVMRLDGEGKCEPVAGSPNARDGARTTFLHADETHRWTLPGLKQAFIISLANLGKRPLAEPWALETTTAPEPGAGSVGESTMDFALELLKTKPKTDPKFFFYHREASDLHDLTTEKGLKAAILEASGPYIAKWTDTDRIARRFRDADADPEYAERVWLNRRVQSSAKAFNVKEWAACQVEPRIVKKGAAITIGFDGSRYDDSTGLVATELSTGYQWVLGVWERPESAKHQGKAPVNNPSAQGPQWEVNVSEVDETVQEAFDQWHVTRMYCDPAMWESWVSKWAGEYGDKRVVNWWTNRRKPMAYAVRAYGIAMGAKEIQHGGNSDLTRHIGNACKLATNLLDDNEVKLCILRKERPDSPHKIDLAMAAILSWEARQDSIAAGDGAAPEYAIHVIGQ